MNSELDTLLLDGLGVSGLQKPLKEIFLCIRTDGATGDGSRENPYLANTAAQFDAIMENIVTENTLVHLGPGLFRTRGGQAAGWLLKSGVHIVGSGIFSTTLRLTVEPTSGRAARGR